MIEHQFPDEQDATRCVHCGTTNALHKAQAQNCVPWWEGKEYPAPRPTHTGRSIGDFAADDAGTISARLRELEAERLAIVNRPAEPD